MELIKGDVSARPASQAGGNPPVGIGADGTIEGARPACKFVSDGYSLHMGTRARDDKREDGKQEHAWVHDALLSGTVENRLLELFSLGKVNGTIHTCMGQEFSAVAFARQLRDGDFVFSNHRCHGHYISFTKDYEGRLAELMGKAAGTCGGIGSSQHLCKEYFYSNGIQSGIVFVAAGFACGIDIESIAEMPRAGDPREEPFYRNNFTQREISYCLLQPDPWASFAGLFCAKESLKKADAGLLHEPNQSIEIRHTGKRPQYPGFSLSISHRTGFAVAVAIRAFAQQPGRPAPGADEDVLKELRIDIDALRESQKDSMAQQKALRSKLKRIAYVFAGYAAVSLGILGLSLYRLAS